MNKQELIKKYEGAFEKLYVFPVVTINEVLEDLRQLDEPQHWFFGSLFIYNNDVDTRTYHTLKQLEQAGFGEVFYSPLFEVEEVEG